MRAHAQPSSVSAFPASRSPAAQAAFVEGVAWLHSFEYEEAIEAFRRAQQIDPRCAMAYWGEAMCYHQSLWLNEDPDAARRALTRLGPTPAARAAAAGSDRARRYLAAAEALFGAGDRLTRVRAHAEAMRTVADDYPDDLDAAAFHGLALLSLSARGLVDPGDHAGEAGHVLAGSETQQEVAAIFERVLRADPRHPGALHYLIHTWDDPAHAERALPAARVYPAVAPQASHALHMPAHIFLQLGLWHDAGAADEASFRASEARVRRRHLPITVRDYHSLSWLTYEYLQQGRFARAEQTLAEIRPAAAEPDQDRLKTLEATMQARIAVETERWRLAEGPQYRNVDELFAIGLGAAARGALAHAEMARQRLAETSARHANPHRRTVAGIMERQVAAAVRLREGRRDEAVSLMREAAALDARLPPPMGPPEPVKPAPEQFGELLLTLLRPAEAALQFEATLRRWRNRSRSVLGLARASAALGHVADARSHYTRFLDNWRDADADLPERGEARDYVARAGTDDPRSARVAVVLIGAAAAIGAIGAIGLLRRRRRHGGRRTSRAASRRTTTKGPTGRSAPS